MDHGTSPSFLLATHFTTSVFPLTVRLIPVITQIGHRFAGDRGCHSNFRSKKNRHQLFSQNRHQLFSDFARRPRRSEDATADRPGERNSRRGPRCPPRVPDRGD